MYSIPDTVDYIGFLFLKAEIQAFFAAKTDHIWMVIKAPEIPHLVCAKNNRQDINGLKTNFLREYSYIYIFMLTESLPPPPCPVHHLRYSFFDPPPIPPFLPQTPPPLFQSKSPSFKSCVTMSRVWFNQNTSGKRGRWGGAKIILIESLSTIKY